MAVSDIARPLPDPRIGILMREGTLVYYACIDGEFPERSTPEAVLALLEGREEPDAPKADGLADHLPVTKDYEIEYLGKTSKKWSEFSVFVVTFHRVQTEWPPEEIRVLAPSGPAAIRATKEYFRRECIFDRFDGRIVYSARAAQD